MASCPTCNKDVDPLRAPSARVIGGRVVAFCSNACAAAAAEAGVAAAKARVAEASEPAAGRSSSVSSAEDALARIRDSGRALPARLRAAKSTNPIEADDVVEERDVGRRARTEPPPPPGSSSGSGTSLAVPRRGRGMILMFAGVIIVGGMAIAIVQTVSPSTPSPAAAVPEPPGSASEPTPPAPPPVDHPAVARRTLSELVHGDSDRVRRVAAAALARTGDPEAIKVLAELLAAETSEITRLDIAYALGRAGDARGIAALTAATKSSRRDVRGDAARWLVLLGDPDGAGTRVLTSFLELRTSRLGAAEPLARIGDTRAIAALTAIHADQAASSDDRIRAAIALGRAKKPEVVPELKALLTDGRFNPFAAAALAELGDPACRDVLVKQLGTPSLRVGAAIALRRLDPGLDPAPLLPALGDALAAGKDVSEVTAAEAILILTGPRAWAERD